MKNWTSFERKGIETDSELAKKLWRVSQILKVSPFDKSVLELNVAQINFVLRMYSTDHPDQFRILDPAIAEGKGPTQIWANWSNVLDGPIKQEFDRSPDRFFEKYFKVSKE